MHSLLQLSPLGIMKKQNTLRMEFWCHKSDFTNPDIFLLAADMLVILDQGQTTQDSVIWICSLAQFWCFRCTPAESPTAKLQSPAVGIFIEILTIIETIWLELPAPARALGLNSLFYFSPPLPSTLFNLFFLFV